MTNISRKKKTDKKGRDGRYSVHAVDKRNDLRYFTLRVRRTLTEKEKKYISSLKDEAERLWEIERQSLLFEIAILGTNRAHAEGRLRNLLQSPELIIEEAGADRNLPTIGAIMGELKEKEEAGMIPHVSVETSSGVRDDKQEVPTPE